jgi:hypothetical protein
MISRHIGIRDVSVTYTGMEEILYGATVLNTASFVQPTGSKFPLFLYPYGKNVSFANANKSIKAILIYFKTDRVMFYWPYF